jgi:hypothetical protein
LIIRPYDPFVAYAHIAAVFGNFGMICHWFHSACGVDDRFYVL